MSKAFSDPSLLTKDRLKKELESNGVKLPRGDQKKDVYVKLYRETISPQNPGRGEFSSDDDDYDQTPQAKQIVPRSSRAIKKVGSKDIVTADISSMTDEELKEELTSLGSPVGPIMPSTRGLYERKLARMRNSLPNNGSTVMNITKSEFSDDNGFDVEEMQDEESNPDDEFFYKRQERNQKSRGNFGSTFTTNFNNTSSKREVTRDFSASSSRNVEHSSTFDRKTTNKVRTKKGDKFEENKWSSSSNQENGTNEQDGGDEVLALPGLPSNIHKALAAARFTPEQSPPPATEIRARPSQQRKSEIPEDIPQRKTDQEKLKSPKQKPSKKWRWILFILILVLIVLVAATVYNFEKLPPLLKGHIQLPAVAENNKTSTK